MINLLELDLADGRWTPPRVQGPAWVLVRHGERVLGEERLDSVDTEYLVQRRHALVRRYSARITAPKGIPDGRRLSPSQISIVVCTRDRPFLLEECLSAMARLDPPPGEVVVVDNASVSGATGEVAARFDVTLVTETVAGLDRARNRGLQTASGEVVAYLDDDARPDTRFVSVLSSAFSHPDIAAVTGLVRPAELDTHPQIAFERLEGGMGKGYSRRLFVGGDVGLHVYRVGVGTNMALRRRVLDELGGFDPRLDVGTATRGGGDLDMFWRVLRSGGVILYEPDLVVRHLHRPHRQGLIEQLRDNGTAYSAFLESCRASDPALGPAVRRERWLWHWRRHVLRSMRALLTGDLLELQLALAEWEGSRSGAAALYYETHRQVGVA